MVMRVVVLKRIYKMSFWKQALLSLVVLAVSTVGLVLFSPSILPFGDKLAAMLPGEAATTQQGAPNRRNRPAPLVVLAEVESIVSDDRVKSVGTAQAIEKTTLFPEATGYVRTILVGAGQRVNKGDIIVQLDNDLQTFAVERAQLSVADAEAQVARFQTLASSNTVSSVQLNNAISDLSKARLDLKEAKDALQRRTVRAPFAGEIGLIDVGVGDAVSPTTLIATLDERRTLIVEFRVPERFANRVGDGQTMELVSPALPGRTLQGKVSGMASRIDTTSRTLTVQGTIANEDDLIRPGMSFEVSLAFPGQNFAAVPALAVLWDRDGSYVWKADADRVKRVDVNIVSRQGDRVLINGDISAGDMVVSDGTQSVRPGQPFRTADERGKGSAAGKSKATEAAQ